MLIKYLRSYTDKIAKKASLRTILIVPFVIQITAAVGLISYLSYTNSRKTVEELAIQLSDRTTDNVKQHVLNYLNNSHRIHQSIVANIDSGSINLNNYSQLQNSFWHQVKYLDSLSFLYFANRKGDFIGVQKKDDGKYISHIRNTSTVPNRNSYFIDKQGNQTNSVIASKEYDPRTRSWYRAAQNTKKPTWSPIYSFASSGNKVLGISPVTPIYDNSGNFQGVLASDLSLGQISNFLRNLKISSGAKIFIVERNGKIIATSSNESPFKLEQLKQQRVEITQSKDILIQQTAKYLIKKYGNFEEIENISSSFKLDNGKRQYLQVQSLQEDKGLDWLILVAIPETDFTSKIDQNTQQTIFLSIIALAIAIAIGSITSHRVTKPILTLNQAAKDIAKGKLDKTVEIEREDEVGELARSFNLMASQLKESFSTLEQRVEERTVELKKSVIVAQKAKEEALAANKAKDNFLVNISHELRTPLNSILGYTKILLSADNLQTIQIISLRIVKQSGTHLLTLINDILDFSKSEAGKIELNPSQFYLLEFLEGVGGIIQMRAKEKSLSFKYEVIGDLPSGIKADEKRLRQVLLNLLGNAVKFTDAGGVILRVSEIPQKEADDKTKIRFEVIDSGIGVSSSQLEKIFQPFEQVGDLENRTAGTGLGLSISKELVELMGSKIQVKSELGRGSTFWFDVTFDAIELTGEEHQQKQNTPIKGYKGDRQYQILVVDDRSENRLLLINLLQPLGFKIIEASDGQQGLEIANSTRPDLILTDLLMPHKTGLTMVLELRQIPQLKDIPIISLSASNSEIMEKKSKTVGCNAFLPKPIDDRKLLALLEQYLELEWQSDLMGKMS
ncbi:MAG: ATP-binding protein [Prochloraceae cyanobacterium]|nr:ATP-binding protein [Prochloraceae cyanobacterium]